MMDKTWQILFYTTDNWKVSLDVRFSDETVRLSQKQMSELFWVWPQTINEHLKNIYKTGELLENSTIRKNRIVDPLTQQTLKVMQMKDTLSQMDTIIFLIN